MCILNEYFFLYLFTYSIVSSNYNNIHNTTITTKIENNMSLKILKLRIDTIRRQLNNKSQSKGCSLYIDQKKFVNS